MAGSGKELYNWERFSKPRVYSRSQKVTTNDDVQSWVKKVEAASDMAAAAAFSEELGSRPRGKAAVQMTIDNVRDHDSALTEAQELLQNWMQEKVLSEANGEDDLDLFEDAVAENWSERRKTKADVKREWDHLVEQTEIDYGIVNRGGTSSRSDKTYYSLLENDPDSLVNEIMSNMMEKDVISGKFFNDLGVEQKEKVMDPRMKMKVRQEQVKLNREKRLQEQEKQRREKRAKKEAHFNARQVIKQEEQKKSQKEKREEEEIQKEMNRIRKEMAEEKKLKLELARKEKEEREKRFGVQEEEVQVSMEMRKQWAIERQKEEERQRIIRQKIAEMDTKAAQDKFKLQRRCFRAWFNLVAQNRLQLGKAKALSDWRLMMKSFNAWRSYTQSQRLSAEALIHQEQIVEAKRKWSHAVNHHRHQLLHICFSAWRIFVVQCHHQRELEQHEVTKRNKMSAFLEAAASGRLWDDGKGHVTDGRNRVISSRSESSIVPDSARQKVDMLFQQAPRPLGQEGTSTKSARSDTTLTSRSNRSRSSERSKKKMSLPNDASQVKREHLNLTNEQIASLTGGAVSNEKEGNTQGGSTSPQKEGSTVQSWQKRFVPNAMEHRHKAQQKLLENQQKQIAGQQKLIEELQYLQRQQLLQQQLTNQQLMQHLLDKKSGDAPTQKVFYDQHLADHIEKLQKELTEMQLGQGDQDVGQRPPLKNAWVETARTDNSSITNVTTARTNITSARTDNITGRTDNTTARTEASSQAGSKVSKPDSVKHRAFLQSMEERAAERTRIKKEREEKKRKEDDEKLARLLAEQEEQKKKDEEEKMQKIEAYREKKRLEKLKEAEKQAAAEKLQHQWQLAAEHSNLATMKFTGWLPWRRLVAMAHEKQERAVRHNESCVLRKHLLSWHLMVAKEVTEKKSVAEEFHNYCITKWCFNNWKMFRHSAIILEQKADRWYNTQLLTKIVRVWWDYSESEKIAMRQKERIAKEHNTERMKRTAFRAWKRFPEMLKNELEKEKRREDLRKKVSSLLPDYEAAPPPPSVSVESNLDNFFKF